MACLLHGMPKAWHTLENERYCGGGKERLYLRADVAVLAKRGGLWQRHVINGKNDEVLKVQDCAYYAVTTYGM